MGSVFSPYYALARRRGDADPQNHCAVNVALYGDSFKRWTMTERGRRGARRDAQHYAIGNSALAWRNGALSVDIDEFSVPVPRRVRGRIVLVPDFCLPQVYPLDAAARHHWHPIAPRARVEVQMQNPRWTWAGHGYLDSNFGTEPLEDAFASWTWSRAFLPDRTVLLYDCATRGGSASSRALEISDHGVARDVVPPHVVPLGRTRWGLQRTTRSDAPARILRTLEDTPFYARSSLATQWEGEPAIGMHESLSLTRFRSPLVQMMLPFRMPRRARW